MLFRKDIQGLRALAFLLVFFFHLNKNWLPGGFLGVDLFFVISGFLMTSITLADIEKGKFTFVGFYLKRLKRIVPAYFVLLLVVALVGGYLWMYSDMGTLKQTVIQSALFISNKLFSAGDNYFGATTNENPLLHTWSLSIEMQFYIFLPFVVYFFRKRLTTLFAVMIIVFTAYASYMLYIQHLRTEMYFSLMSRIPEFIVGGIYALLFKNGIDVKRIYNNLLAFGSFAVLLVCSVFISEESYFPGVLAFIPCVAGANLLVLKNNSLSEFLSSNVPVYVGELSYSLYLWHFPVMAFLRYRNDSYSFTITEVIFIAVCTFVFAWLSYRFIESSFRKVSDISFLKFATPLALGIVGLAFCLPKITKYKKIPDIYIRSSLLGGKSHNNNFVDKFGDLARNDSIALIGNSHALAIKPFLDYIGKKNHFSYKTITCGAYLSIEGVKENEIPINGNQLRLYRISQSLVAPTKKLIDNSTIIIINNKSFTKLPSLKTALEKLIMNLRKDQKLVLLKTFPVFNENPIKVNHGYIKTSDHKFVKRISELQENEDYLKRLANNYKNVYFYDLSKSKIFENAPYINDTIAYYDAVHINNFGAIKLAKDLDEDFMDFFNKVRGGMK